MPKTKPTKRKKQKLAASQSGENWREKYETCRELYVDYAERLKNLITDLLAQEKIDTVVVECRGKDVESFISKITSPKKSYKNPLKEITDLSGVRIIVYYQEDIDRVSRVIEREFRIDRKNSIDKSQILHADQFGYLSIHYVVNIQSPRRDLEEWKKYSGLKAEIQIRTVLQHAWAAVDHKLRYKTKRDIPKTLKRQLYRLSALFELADEEFTSISEKSVRIRVKYRAQIKSGTNSVAIDGDSLRIFLKNTNYSRRYDEILVSTSNGFFMQGPGLAFESRDISELVYLLQELGIGDIGKFEQILDSNQNKATKLFSRFIKGYRSTYSSDHIYLIGYSGIQLLLFGLFSSKITPAFLTKVGYRGQAIDAVMNSLKA